MSTADGPAATQPQTLALGKCEQCRDALKVHRFALWYDHPKRKRSCAHLVCGTCRGIMNSWNKPHCPNSKCGKRFYAIQDAICPSTDSLDDFFKFVDVNQTGRVTRDELAVWYTTNFDITQDAAMNMISSNWHCWDVPKSHSFLAGGWFRPKDEGDLDKDEFKAVQEFMGESLKRSLAISSAAASSVPSSSSPAAASSSDPRGTKRSPPRDSESSALTEGVLRNVAQKKAIQSEELQRKLSTNKGREWFDHFDLDKSLKLEKGEIITALLQTFMGSHGMNRETTTSIVENVWDAIDADGGGSVDFDEFQMLREAMVAQLSQDKVNAAVSAGLS